MALFWKKACILKKRFILPLTDDYLKLKNALFITD